MSFLSGLRLCLYQLGKCNLFMLISTSSAMICNRNSLIQQVFAECLISSFSLLCHHPLLSPRPFPSAFQHPQGALILKTKQIKSHKQKSSSPQTLLPSQLPPLHNQISHTECPYVLLHFLASLATSSSHCCPTPDLAGTKGFMERALPSENTNIWGWLCYST